MGIKVIYLGAMHAKGTSKKGAYDFCQVKYASPLKSVTAENRTVVAFGSEEATVDLDPSVINQFAEFRTGDYVVLEVGPNPTNLQRNICTGVSVSKG